MDKQEAITILEGWLSSSKRTEEQCGYIEGWFYEKDVEAFRMAIEALEQEPKEDCISREYILSFLDGEYWGDDDYIAGMNDEQREIREVVRNAPSVTPTERTGEWVSKNGWSYCSNCGKDATPQNNGCAIEPCHAHFCQWCGADMGMKGADDE